MQEGKVSEPEISAEIPDWSREMRGHRFWDPPRALLRSIRDYQGAKGLLAPIRRKYAVLRHRLWSVVTGADIPLTSSIGGGLLIPHPNGIVIHPDAKIGCNCLIFQQVTIGATTKGIPTIRGHVDIGAGAKIIGPVEVGEHARIGANAVVHTDVPAFGTFVANPGGLLEGAASQPPFEVDEDRLEDLRCAGRRPTRT
jgi:serine O-acetyltransferase